MKKSDIKAIIICASIIIVASLVILLINKEETTPGERTNYMHNYDVNEVQYYYISEEEMAKKYLADFVNKIYYFPEDAYELLHNDYKVKFKDYNDFKSYIDKNLKSINFQDTKVVKYGSTIYDRKNSFNVVDNAGNTFIFIEESIMDYKVIIK